MPSKRDLLCTYVKDDDSMCRQYCLTKRDSNKKKVGKYNYCKNHLKIITSEMIVDFIESNYKNYILKKNFNTKYYKVYWATHVLSNKIKNKLSENKAKKKIHLLKFYWAVNELRNCKKENLIALKKLFMSKKMYNKNLLQNAFNIFYNKSLCRLFNRSITIYNYFNLYKRYYLEETADKSSRDDVCPICLGDVTKEQERNKEIVELPGCKHFYHFKCLNEYTLYGSDCPKCKVKLFKTNIKYSYIGIKYYCDNDLIKTAKHLHVWQCERFIYDKQLIIDYVESYIDVIKRYRKVDNLKIKSFCFYDYKCKLLYKYHFEKDITFTTLWLEYFNDLTKDDEVLRNTVMNNMIK